MYMTEDTIITYFSVSDTVQRCHIVSTKSRNCDN